MRAYGKIYALGHRAIRGITDGPVVVEEKIDGSQFSFMVQDGQLFARSKGRDIDLDNPDKLFVSAVETIKEIRELLIDGVRYRGETLCKPKHNVLKYSRVPEKNIIIFDMDLGIENYAPPEYKQKHAADLGLECVPILFEGELGDYDIFHKFLEHDSVLGGTKIEGVVVKRYDAFTMYGNVMMGKYVSEAFKEQHRVAWKPGKDIVAAIIEAVRTEARWNKAVLHLNEQGQIVHEPRDIGAIIKDVVQDIREECEDEIKDRLFEHFWRKISKGAVGGLAEWYKEKLAKEQFDES